VTHLENEPQSDLEELLRLFVSLPVPLQVQEAVEQAQANLRRALPSDLARWTRREQFHLTLRFLGNVESACVADLLSRLRDACHHFKPLSLQAAGLGSFPEKRFPRVLWVGLQDATNQMPLLYEAVRNAVSAFTSQPAEREFSAHITLARLKQIQRSEAERLKQVLTEFQHSTFGEWVADEVHLMRSQLSSLGAQHTVLARFELGK
jgi:2'-5' RNA ligase